MLTKDEMDDVYKRIDKLEEQVALQADMLQDMSGWVNGATELLTEVLGEEKCNIKL